MKAMLNYLGLVLTALVLTGLWLFAMALPGRAAGGPGQCAPFASVIEQLAGRYGEAPIGRGLGSGGGYVVTLFAHGAGDTFTIVGVTPEGTACILVTGTGWETVKPAPTGTEG